MSFRDAVKRRLGMSKKPTGHWGTTRGVEQNQDQATAELRRQQRLRGGMKFNPTVKLDTSQVKDRRMPPPGTAYQAWYGDQHGPTTGTIPGNQRGDLNTATGRRDAIQRRQTKRRK